jgi:shikimate 5-dehydrogenase
MTMKPVTLAAALAAFALLAGPAVAGGGGEKRTVLSCANVGVVDISMTARNIERVKKGVKRIQFKVEFEAAPGLGFNAGAVLDFAVDGTKVGSKPLKVVPGGDLEAELELDSSKRGPKAPPPGFAPRKGSLVEVISGSTAVLSCALD